MDITLQPINCQEYITPIVDYNPDEATVQVKDNKLILSKEAIKALDAKANDRIAIQYWSVDLENSFPVIGRAECFSVDGNRLTKSNTVSYRGSQKDTLLAYGDFFKLERFNNYYKMVAVDMATFVEDTNEFNEEEDYLNMLNDLKSINYDEL